MAWNGSQRTHELPDDWKTRRQAVKLRADGQCENTLTSGHRCTAPGTECHHAGDKHDHRLESLRWLCHDCHDQITQQQARAAQIIARAKAVHPSHRRRYITDRLGEDVADSVLDRRGSFIR